MIRKLLAAVALALGALALLGPASPAHAGGDQGSDYADCLITVSDTELAAGDEVQVSGSGLQPDFQTDLVFDRGEPSEEILATVTTDGLGGFGPTTVTIPADADDGPHTISVSCDAENVNTTTVIISGTALGPTDGGTSGNLPTTGSDPEPLLILGAAAIVAGVAFVLVARRRRTSADV